MKVRDLDDFLRQCHPDSEVVIESRDDFTGKGTVRPLVGAGREFVRDNVRTETAIVRLYVET